MLFFFKSATILVRSLFSKFCCWYRCKLWTCNAESCRESWVCKYKIPLKMFCCFTAIKSTKTQPCHVTEIYTQRHSPNTKRSCIHNIQNSSVVTQLCYLIIYFSISYNLVSVGSDVVAKIVPNFHIKGQSLVFIPYCNNRMGALLP